MVKCTKLNITIPSKKKCSLLILILSFIYLLDNLSFLSLNSNEVYIYIIKPIMWCSIIAIVWIFPRIRSKGKLKLRHSLIWWTIYLGFFYTICVLLGGIINGFGKSPYDFSPLGILKNLILMGSIIIGREFIRSYLVNSLSKKHFLVMVGIFTIFMTFINLPINKLYNLKTGIDIVQYLSEYLLPELSKNIFAVYLVYLGGPILSIIYFFIIEGCFWFCPILPDLNWITKGLIGILCPTFSLMFLQYIYDKEAKTTAYKKHKSENPIKLIITSIFSIAIVWFALGVFPIHPNVIATGSMNPMINPGDIVLVKKVDGNTVKKGEVIQFKRDNIYIFHRIIDIKVEKNNKKYVTKGDNNSVQDSELVTPEDVKGTVIYVIPKLGWPTLFLKDTKNVPKEKVEF